MIVDRGAVEAALERWCEQRKYIFYPKTDLDFDPAEIARRKQELGAIDLTKLGSVLDEEVRAIEFLPNAGTFHALFRVQTAANRYILKLSLDASAFGFAIESWIQSSLRVAAFEAIPKSLPCPFLVMDEAQGRSLTTFENPDTQAMPEPLLFEFGRNLARVHQVHGEKGGLLDVRSLRGAAADGQSVPRGLSVNWQSYIHTRLHEHIKTCRIIGAIDETEGLTIEAHFAYAAQLLYNAPSRLLHGDPGHHNAFSDGERITALIDWEDSLIGDPVFDIAYWGTFVRDEMRARFLEGYETVEKLPAEFERLYWLYYLRVALSKTVHRFRFDAKDRPGRPPASQRIQKALSNLGKL